jgi:hypothetical protein
MTHTDIKPADYHSKLKCNRENIFADDSYLSKSVLWELNESSLYKWRYFPKRITPSPAMAWGSLVDCLTTTPELAETEIVVSPFDSYRTKEAKEWKEANRWKTITTTDELDAAKLAAKMLTETHKGSAEIFAKSKGQAMVMGKVLGCNVKGLIDLAPEGEDFLADLKTTGDFTERGFQSTLAKFGYSAQGFLYLSLWNAMYPDDQRDRFKIIWQDREAPYEVAVTEITQEELELGGQQILFLLEKLVQAAKSDVWPMKFESEILLTRPAWAAREVDAKMSVERNGNE